MIAIAAATILDLCSAPPAALAPDAADSRAYLEAGDEARAAGDLRIAALAYRKAIALDATNVRARDALAALCRTAGDAGEEALLAAVALYRRGELAAAERALEQLDATAGGGPHLFRGLIALRRHDRVRAVRELELARRDPAYAEAAASVLRLARRDGGISVVALLGTELDTNPQLVPDTPPPGALSAPPATDVDAIAIATVTARPARWFGLRDTLVWRDQLQQSALDFLGNNLKAFAELEGGHHRVTISTDVESDVLDGSSYLLAGHGAIAYRHELDRVALVAGYGLRRRAFQQDAQALFTGWVQTGEVGAQIAATDRLDLELRAIGGREQTADAAFSNVSAGGQLGARARIASRARIVATTTWSYARHDATESVGSLRHDVHGEATLDAEIDLGDHLFAIAGTSFVHNSSTIEDFRYDKLVVRVGLALAFGAL